MRRIGAWFGLTFLGVVAPVAFAVAAFAPGVAEAAGCEPAITSIGTQESPYAGSGRVDIVGNCFGTASAFAGEDRSFLRVSVLAPGTSLPNSLWNACWTGDPGTDTVTCNVSEWTDTHITVAGYGGQYGQNGFVISAQNDLAIQVWNAQTGAGPSIAVFRGGFAVGIPAAPTGTHNAHQSSTAHLSSNAHQSSIARALASPAHAFSSVSADVVNATIAVAAVLFITFPANLFNQTFEENYADIRAWWRRRFGWLAGKRKDETADAAEPAETETGRVKPATFAAVIGGGALLGGLLDPEFGFNLRSVLTVVALAVAICVGIAVPVLVTQAYYRARHTSARLQIRALPAGLAIAGVCVFISRVSGFQPGYLYGIVAGVVLGRTLARREQAHLIVLTTLAVIGVSVLAWIAWAGLNGTAEKANANDMVVLVDDALAAMFVAGLVGSVIGMLPLRFMPGHVLKSWSTRLWAAVFAVSLFGLIQVMVRPNATAEGPSHAPLVTTLVLFAVFAAGTVAFRWHFIRKQRRAAGEPPLTWQQALVRIAGEARTGSAQLAATTDGVTFVDVTEPVVDLTEPVVDLTEAEVKVPAQRTPRPRKAAAAATSASKTSGTATVTTKRPPRKKT